MQKFSLLACFLGLLVCQQLPAQQESQAEKPLPDGVIAERGNGIVTRDIFDARMAKIPAKDRAGVLRSSDRTQKIMGDLLLVSQLKAHAVASGFDKGDVQYRMQLAADNELANAWLEHYIDSQPDADYRAMAWEYYLVNKEQFVSQPSVDVTHLLIMSEGRTDEQLNAKAQSYLDQVLADPTLFDDLVMSFSEDPSVQSNQGHFKGVKKGAMVKPFEEAAFALEEPGDFSGLVKSSYGIHIIRLDKKTPSSQLGFEEVESKLMAQQKESYREQLKYTYLNELDAKPWNVSEEELKLMVQRYSEQENALIESNEQNIE